MKLFCCKREPSFQAHFFKLLLARLRTCNAWHRRSQCTKEQCRQPAKLVCKHPDHQGPDEISNHIDGPNDALDVALAARQPKIHHNGASDKAGVVNDVIGGALHQFDVRRIPANLTQVKLTQLRSGHRIRSEIIHAKVSTVARFFEDEFWSPWSDKVRETLQVGVFVVRPAGSVYGLKTFTG